MVSGVSGCVFVGQSLPQLEEGTLSPSFDSQAGSFSSRICQAGIFQNFLCDYTENKTFSSPLRSSLTSSESGNSPLDLTSTIPSEPQGKNILQKVWLVYTYPVPINH